MDNLESRIDKRLRELDRRQKWLCSKIGVTSQRITNWKSRGQIPAVYLFKVAEHLKCSPEWLTGTEENKNRIYLSETEKMLLQKFRSLPKTLQERELTYLRGLVTEEGAVE